MRLQDWLELFRSYRQIKVFHLQHLKTLTEMNHHTLQVALKRLTHRKVIHRICRGYYANPLNLPTVEEIAAEIYKPSYLSLESALYRHGILSQTPFSSTCVTTRLPREFHTSFGLIQYRQIKKAHFFGFVAQGGYFLAEPEKALVDFLYLNRHRDIRGMLSEFHLGSLRLPRLKSYAKRLRVTMPPLAGKALA